MFQVSITREFHILCILYTYVKDGSGVLGTLNFVLVEIKEHSQSNQWNRHKNIRYDEQDFTTEFVNDKNGHQSAHRLSQCNQASSHGYLKEHFCYVITQPYVKFFLENLLGCTVELAFSKMVCK